MDDQKVFFEACKAGNLKQLEEVIDLVDVNVKDENGDTGLVIASRWGHSGVVERLMKVKGINPSLYHNVKAEEIHFDCAAGLMDKLSINIDLGMDVETRTCKGATPLIVAAASNAKTVRCLLSKGADINAKKNDGNTALHIACKLSSDNSSDILIDRGAAINAQNTNGRTPLHLCVYNKKADHCALLLDKGANANIQDEWGWTPLHLACRKGQASFCRALLRNGPRVDPDDDDTSPMYGKTVDVTEIVCKHLVANKASVDIQDKRGNTPLHVAAIVGHVASCRLFLERGADIDKRNDLGRTALHHACAKGQNECCILLLERGASVQLPDKKGFSPLHLASKFGQPVCVKILIENGAVVNCEEASQDTPLFHASKNGHLECVIELLKQGADPSMARDGGKRLIDVAKINGHSKVAALLGNVSTVPIRRTPNRTLSSRYESDTDECGYFQLCRHFIGTFALDDCYFYPFADVCFCTSCHESRGDNLYYPRGNPPKDYGLPIGWVKFGLNVTTRAGDERPMENWHVAFHGTRACKVQKILRTADLLMPGDVTPGGGNINPLENHYDVKNPKMQPPAGHDINKIYLSPSIKYAGSEVYAPKSKYKDPTTKIEHQARVAFQVRIKPGTYEVGHQTVVKTRQIDPKFPNSELEWSTKRRGVIILVGLLVKVEELLDL